MFKTVLALAVLLPAVAAQAATQTLAAVARSAQACDVVVVTGPASKLERTLSSSI